MYLLFHIGVDPTHVGSISCEMIDTYIRYVIDFFSLLTTRLRLIFPYQEGIAKGLRDPNTVHPVFFLNFFGIQTYRLNSLTS